MKIVYYIIFVFWYLLSLLPLRVLYVLSDLLFFPIYYLFGYRKKVVRKNLTQSFPNKNEKEIKTKKNSLCLRRRTTNSGMYNANSQILQ